MKKTIGGLALAALVISAVGCNRSKTDDELIREAVTNSDYFSTRSIEGTGTKAMDTLDYLTWWREATSHPDPYLEISRVGDSAYVVFSGKALGNFHILLWGGGDSVKPFGDSATIEGIVKNLGTDEDPDWQVTDVTGVHAISYQNPPSFTIDSVRVIMGGTDTVFLDPMNMFAIEDVMTLNPGNGDTVKCWAWVSGAAVDGAMHLIGKDEHHRIDFQDSTTFFYTQFARSAENPGVHFIGIDFFNKSTLDDTDYPYECRLWLLPYMVE